MTTNGTIRASDQDREHVVELLRTHYSEGRLTLEEFDERVAAAYAGKTWGDLLDLTSDLPVQVRLGADQAPTANPSQAGVPDGRGPSPGEPSPGLRAWPGFALAPLVPLALAVVLISSTAWAGIGYGPGHHWVRFFPVWPLLLITVLFVLLFLRRGPRWGRGSWHR